MYVVKYKQRVVLGIIPWNNQYIQDVMKNRYRVDIELPYIEPESSEFPYQVNEDTVIYPATEDRDVNINPMIQQYYGPTWEFLEDRVIAHYEILDLELSAAQNNYKERAAAYRYNKEISGTKITLNNKEYVIETDRVSRTKYVEKFLMMEENQTVNWKFSQDWITLTKQDLQNIVHAIDSHVQGAFDWELNLINTIDSITNLQDLTLIEDLNPPPPTEQQL